MAGRPRSAEVNEKVLNAAKELLEEVGPDLMSIDAVARRAGVGKASIYRRYSNKAELITDVLKDIKDISYADLLEEDFRASILNIAKRFITSMNTAYGRKTLAIIVNTLVGDKDISHEYWSTHTVIEVGQIADIFKDYQAKGSLKADLDVHQAAEILVSYLMYQVMFKYSNQTDNSLERGIDFLISSWQ
ncbi:hypothetical protein IV56_GL000212 [Lacticaseibacillus saniviri JCM 17471 = DSM 24301]|uniref:HTH tetR-type domain-containing protein n=2 Tax=Lacticaseibacillus saniviri TaxID=931533 RepID=A0A0R2MN60_9LACO|nr:hypothetical protein IV56_GL000212 [Lacticaseibacillus saniviri JCM 17471 = DSM 24301]